MAWTNWPFSGTVKEQSYSRVIQLWKARREKDWATRYPVPREPWPRLNVVGDEGIAGSTTLTTMQDLTKSWSTSPKRWLSPDPTDIIFDDFEPALVVRSHITDNTSNTVTFDTIVDYVTGGIISGPGDLSGKHYMIIRAGGLWYDTRWLPPPNEQERWRGTVFSGTTSTLTIDLTVFKTPWEPDQFVGDEFMIVGSDGRLHRTPITGNTKDTLLFAVQTWTPSNGDRFAIVPAGAKWMPHRNIVRPPIWYTGIYQNYWTITPDLAFDVTPEAAVNTTISMPDGFGNCVDTVVPAFDRDVWTDGDNECDPDSCKSPDLYHSFRALQNDIPVKAGDFIEKKDYSGFDGGGTIPNFTPATMFYKAGINAFSFTAGTYFGGGYSTGVVPPYAKPVGVVWTALNANGSVARSGTGSVDASGYISGTGLDSGTDGLQIIYSYTWTRLVPRRVRYMYAKTIWIPDWEIVPIDPDIPELGSELNLYDPPDATHPGRWITRGASTTYMEYDSQGLAADTTETFTDGDLVRYVGDNWNDPTIVPHDPYQLDLTGPSRPGGHAPDTQYWGNFYRGKLPPIQQAVWESSKRGVATGGTVYYLEDTDKNWWPDGLLRTESGTATGGSTTTLVDTTKIGTPYWSTSDDRWNKFVLKITKASDHTVWYVPITGTNRASGYVSFAAVSGLTVVAGDTYEIFEPRLELNRWQGRTLRITKLDGTTVDVLITNSDDKRIYFAAQSFAVVAGMRYEVIEIPYGSVLKWSSTDSKFAIAAGADVRGQPFRARPQNNMPNIVKRFGPMMKGDYIAMDSTSTVENEIYRTLNTLRWTKAPLSWTSRLSPSVAEQNYGVAGGPSTFGEVWTDSITAAETIFDNYVAEGTHEFTGLPPLAASTGNSGTDGSNFDAGLERRYAYGVVTNIPDFMASSVSFLNYAEQYPAPVADDAGNIHDFDFEDEGDPVAENLWTEWDSNGPSHDVSRQSTKLGSLDHPTWCPEPDPPGPDFSPSYHTARGYQVTHGMAIIMWDVAGGMTYID